MGLGDRLSFKRYDREYKINRVFIILSRKVINNFIQDTNGVLSLLIFAAISSIDRNSSINHNIDYII